MSPVTANETDHGTSDRSESKTEKQKEELAKLIIDDGTPFSMTFTDTNSDSK